MTSLTYSRSSTDHSLWEITGNGAHHRFSHKARSMPSLALPLPSPLCTAFHRSFMVHCPEQYCCTGPKCPQICREPAMGVILVSPLASGARVVFPKLKNGLLDQVFCPSIDKIDKVPKPPRITDPLSPGDVPNPIPDNLDPEAEASLQKIDPGDAGHFHYARHQG